jgi:hypothetical protein
MKNVMYFNELFENNNHLKNHIINKDDAIKLFSLEEDNLGPTDKYTDDDFNNFLIDYVGKTLWEYSKHRFPDNPYKQFGLAVDVLDF